MANRLEPLPAPVPDETPPGRNSVTELDEEPVRSEIPPEAEHEISATRRDAHPRAAEVFRKLHLHSHLPEPESRLAELIDYFGWETGHKAPACKRWFFRDDPKFRSFLDKLEISETEFAIMHNYALINRLDPERPDMYWLYDEVVERLETLGGKEKLSVFDFGCGPGQIGLAFALDGYRVVLNDKEKHYLDFARFIFQSRRLEPVIWRSPSPTDYYDTAADGHPFGLVVEWSVFEHVPESIRALDKITGGLIPGGVLISTTLGKNWTPELREHYTRDSEDEHIAEQIFGKELEDYVGDNFEIVSDPRSVGKLLVKKG